MTRALARLDECYAVLLELRDQVRETEMRVDRIDAKIERIRRRLDALDGGHRVLHAGTFAG